MTNNIIIVILLFFFFIYFIAELNDCFVARDTSTWIEGIKICQGATPPMSMASYGYLNNNTGTELTRTTTKDKILRELNGTSGWLYGLEGYKKGGNVKPI